MNTSIHFVAMQHVHSPHIEADSKGFHWYLYCKHYCTNKDCFWNQFFQKFSLTTEHLNYFHHYFIRRVSVLMSVFIIFGVFIYFPLLIFLFQSVHNFWFFVSLGFFVRHHYRWRTANFEFFLALMVIEQWGFFSVPHLLWHRASVYNGHLRGPVTLTPIAEGLAVELSLHVFTTWGCRGEDTNTQASACEATALTQCNPAAVHNYLW